MGRVAITGASGFLGTYVSHEAQRRGHEAILARGHSDYDLLKMKQTRSLVRGCDAVIHIAARVGGIGANVVEPGLFFYENMQMGLNVLEAARLEDVRKVVLIGTACEYPETAPVPTNEFHLWQGYPAPSTAPYAIAKKSLAVMGEAYYEQYGVQVQHVIPTNLYGPLDHFNTDAAHVIPSIITKCSVAQARNEHTVTLWGTGKPTRDFLHVTDAARGILDAMELDVPSGPINLSTGVETSIEHVARLIADRYGIPNIAWDTSKPDGTPRRCLSYEQARTLLGWRPIVPLSVGIAETVNWYEDWD